MTTRVFAACLCLAFGLSLAGCDDGGDTKKLGGSALAAGTKGLKKKATGAGATLDGKSSSNSSEDVGLPDGPAGNVQDGDGGDPLWEDCAEDVDGDGQAESVDVLLDDETGTAYLHWTDSEDVDGDGTPDPYEVWAVVHEDGSSEILVVFPGQGLVRCDVDAAGEAACEACDLEGQQCEPLGDDDMGGGFDEDPGEDDCEGFQACYEAGMDDCFDDTDCLDALESACQADHPCAW